jgi:hypothetical protein
MDEYATLQKNIMQLYKKITVFFLQQPEVIFSTSNSGMNYFNCCISMYSIAHIILPVTVVIYPLLKTDAMLL